MLLKLVLFQLLLVQVLSRKPITPYLYTCPGLTPEDDAQLMPVKIGIMLSMPTNNELAIAGLNYTLEPGELYPGDVLVYNYSSLAEAALDQAKEINANRTILPNHKLCLYYTFVPNDINDITLGSNYLFSHSRTYQTINALKDPYLFKVHRDLMVSFGNMVNVVDPVAKFECPNPPNAFDLLFGDKEIITHNEKCEYGLFDTNMNLQIGPMPQLKAAKLLMKEMGWKKYGVLTTCTNQEVWHQENKGIYLSHYTGDLKQSFTVFRDKEIRIILFAGCACEYFDFLIQAYDNKVSTSKQFAFVFPMLSLAPLCGLTYRIKRLCDRNFTPEEVFKIKSSIDKTIISFPICSDVYSGNLKEKAQHSFCIKRFITDAVTLSAIAANNVLDQKAAESGNNKSALVVEKRDYSKVSEQLMNISFEGKSGTIQFDDSCNRITNRFAAATILVNNFTSKVFIFKDDLKNVAEIHTFKNGGNVYFESKFIFKDNTTNVPPDTIEKPYIRNNQIVYPVLFFLILIYITVIMTWCIYTHQADKKLLSHRQKWMLSENDVNFISGPNLQGQSAILHVDNSTTLKTNKSTSSGIYANNLIQIHKVHIPLTEHITNVMEKDIRKILDLTHKNLCKFYGCVTNSNNNHIIGLMHEYTARGNLYELLINKEFQFSDVFRTSFCLDAIHGLQYLHGKSIIHGRLNSLNCFINEYWTLKLTNFGLEIFLHNPLNDEENNKTFVEWKAPECRLLNKFPNKKADIYSLGALLKEIGSRKSILTSLSVQKGEHELVYDPNLSTVYIKLVQTCMSIMPEERCSLDMVRAGIKGSHGKRSKILLSENIGALEMYSNNLAKKVQGTLAELQLEKEQTDCVLGNYIPKFVVSKLRSGTPIPIKKLYNITIVYIKLENFERIIEKTRDDVASGMILNIDDSINYICHNQHQLDRIHSSGSLWIYVGGVYNTSIESFPVKSAAEAALALKEELKNKSFSITVALHTGSLVCGLVTETIPVHITAGNAFNHGLKILSLGQSGRVIMSEEYKQKLNYRSNQYTWECETINFRSKEEPFNMYYLCTPSTFGQDQITNELRTS